MASFPENAQLTAMKRLAGRSLFALSGIRRIHIIGCSRSGTTVLHLAMVHFLNTTISEVETGIEYPHFSARLGIALKHGLRPGQKFYVTKRNYGWFEPSVVESLIRVVQQENVGLIHIVRDPRDVMLSRIVGSARDQSGLPYVSPQHWYDSIRAADRAFDALKNHRSKLTVRYEDLVLDPARIERQISGTLGVVPNPQAFPLDRVKDNFELLRPSFDPESLRNAGGLRNLEPKSIGKWRSSAHADVASFPPQIRERFEAFCAEHGYV